jgi:hypothetical protein
VHPTHRRPYQFLEGSALVDIVCTARGTTSLLRAPWYNRRRPGPRLSPNHRLQLYPLPRFLRLHGITLLVNMMLGAYNKIWEATDEQCEVGKRTANISQVKEWST